MANTFSNDRVHLTVPIRPDMELAAAKLTSAIAEYMGFSNEQTENIQLRMIESCINAFEHNYNPYKALAIITS